MSLPVITAKDLANLCEQLEHVSRDKDRIRLVTQASEVRETTSPFVSRMAATSCVAMSVDAVFGLTNVVSSLHFLVDSFSVVQ